ncbi:meiosis initiator protein [Danio rerio]|uniref:Meiosis initiator protein n=2 Tax=Danio rerio TaxID=7955 RepID=A0AC58IAZ9_DANRE
MLQCLNFHQSHIHNQNRRVLSHCLPQYNDKKSESESKDTPPQFMKAKNMNTYSRINKYTVQLSDNKRDSQTKDCVRFIINAVEELVCNRQSNSSQTQPTEDKESWPVEDSEASQSSTDSNSTISSSFTASSSESTCSVQSESEDGSPGRKSLDTPPLGSGIRLKDPMLGAFPVAWKKHFAFSTTLPKTPVRPLQETESLILNPSLLISPSQGLSCSLFPEGQGALESLFEDVWVTHESTILKSPSSSDSFEHDSESVINVETDRFAFMKNKPKIKDEMPKQLIPLKKARKVCPHLHTSRRGRVSTQPNPKKKCVNGFLMFCRINRKLYIRSYPGIPSTTVTKELANLWHILPKRERRLYCLKACSFSRKQNRNVRAEVHEAERKAEQSAPSPLHILLAYKEVIETVK